MTSQGAWAASTSPPPEESEWVARPRLAPSDFPTLLWRERTLMVGVFLVIFLIGAGVAMSLKKLYSAQSSVLVRLGQEYVYEPSAGDAARGALPANGQVLESETEIMGSDALKEKVIQDVGYARLHPSSARAFAAAGPARKQRMIAQAVLDMRRNLKIESAPDRPVIRLTYADPDPVNAALVLNTLLADYLVYRRAVLLAPTASALAQQRRSFEDRLGRADAAYQDFLSNNRIGDFEAEKTSLSELQAQIEQQRYAAAAQMKERAARLEGLQAGLGQLAPEVGLYRDIDNTGANKLLDLKLQREALLSRYRPDAQPVRDLDAQITQLSSALASGRAQGQGAARTGLNPVYQTLQTEKLQLAAEVAALRESFAALTEQSAELTERRLRLSQIEPRFQALSRDRDVLQTNVRDFTVKEEESQAAREISANTNDNIRIVQRASPPAAGRSLRKPVLALAFLFAAFSAICAGLLRMFLRPGLPTPASASRTLDLPVLGMAAVK
ncbi:MAG TPA: Wzz/FepE/Etk N-terminal domain-containing protein [Caulobacteraceae bacterium]|nr:Wzz/FepE/Etk N-terminal domain-containing protein [Caulobacteraceae bacterium]